MGHTGLASGHEPGRFIPGRAPARSCGHFDFLSMAAMTEVIHYNDLFILLLYPDTKKAGHCFSASNTTLQWCNSSDMPLRLMLPLFLSVSLCYCFLPLSLYLSLFFLPPFQTTGLFYGLLQWQHHPTTTPTHPRMPMDGGQRKATRWKEMLFL